MAELRQGPAHDDIVQRDQNDRADHRVKERAASDRTQEHAARSGQAYAQRSDDPRNDIAQDPATVLDREGDRRKPAGQGTCNDEDNQAQGNFLENGTRSQKSGLGRKVPKL